MRHDLTGRLHGVLDLRLAFGSSSSCILDERVVDLRPKVLDGCHRLTCTLSTVGVLVRCLLSSPRVGLELQVLELWTLADRVLVRMRFHLGGFRVNENLHVMWTFQRPDGCSEKNLQEASNGILTARETVWLLTISDTVFAITIRSLCSMSVKYDFISNILVLCLK